MSGETKEPTMTTLEDGGEGGLVINTAPSLASRLNQRADLLRRIFSFHKTRNPKHYINLRSSSKLFHRALPPPPLWTSFPHSNYATLQILVNRLEGTIQYQCFTRYHNTTHFFLETIIMYMYTHIHSKLFYMYESTRLCG